MLKSLGKTSREGMDWGPMPAHASRGLDVSRRLPSLPGRGQLGSEAKHVIKSRAPSISNLWKYNLAKKG